MSVGRKPKPSAVKALAGNPGKRALNAAEPQPAVPDGPPNAPRFMAETAQREWRRIVRFLLDAGIYTHVDHATLEAYCVVYGRWIDAEKQVQELGPIIETVNGNMITNPYLAVANRCLKQMQSLAAEFGMTPSSRSRVAAINTGKDVSLADLLFASVDDDQQQ